MAGKLPPETENPVPEIESELIVTAAVPLEVTDTDFVTAVPTATLPNDIDVELSLSAGAAAFSCSATLIDEEFALAVKVAVCDVLTEDTFAVNEAVDAREATVTLAGTFTAVLLLTNETLAPLEEAGELSDTVHVLVPELVNEVLPHENALSVGARDDVV